MTSVPHSGAKSVTPGGSVAGHTPGPWFTEYRLTMRGGYSQEVFDAEGKVIATAAWFPVSLTDTTTTTNREANARLIAAAPDLLAAARDADYALTNLIEGFEFGDDDSPTAPCRAEILCGEKACDECGCLKRKRDDARAAIAKATAGETRNAEPIHRRDGDEG